MFENKMSIKAKNERRRNMKRLIGFFRDEEGATAVEYGLMVAAIAAVIVLVVFSIGTEINDAFQTVLTELEAH